MSILPNKANSRLSAMRQGPLFGGAKGAVAPPPIPPIPGPMYFSTDTVGMTVYETEFDVAEPDIVFGMSFAFTGMPTFTVTHQGETLDDVHVKFSQYGEYGVITAVGRGLTVEVGSIKIECTGGTFGPCFGGANEVGFVPGNVRYAEYDQYISTISDTFPVAGKVFLISATGWSFVYPSVEAPLNIRAFRKDIASATVHDVLAPTGGAGLGWTYDAVENRYSHTIPNTTQSVPTDIDVFPPLSGTPLGWKVWDVQTDQAIPQLSTYFHSSVENRTQNIKAYPTGDIDGSWIAYTSYGFDVDQSYARAVGNTSFKDPIILVDPAFNCGAIASSDTNDVSSWNYDNTSYIPTAMIVALIEPA